MRQPFEMSKGGLVEFKPARRVFAGRGRSLMTFGEWKIAFAAMAFGGLIGAGWFYNLPHGAGLLALAQPPAEAPTPQVAPAPVETAGIVEAAAQPDSVLPQVVLAAAATDDDGRVDRAGEAGYLIAEAARVVDGDTLYLEGVATRIRLWGVDAPEREEPGFDEATQMLAGLVTGETLSCEHVDTDRYLRIVARCYFADGRDLSEAMIESGAATEYLRFTQGYYSGE